MLTVGSRSDENSTASKKKLIESNESAYQQCLSAIARLATVIRAVSIGWGAVCVELVARSVRSNKKSYVRNGKLENE